MIAKIEYQFAEIKEEIWCWLRLQTNKKYSIYA